MRASLITLSTQATLFTLALPLCWASAACGPEFAVRPQGGAPHVSASAAGVLLTAFADQWAAEPRDLADIVTPIAVDIYNGTGVEVRVTLSDFALRTEGGVRLQALNPFSVPVAQAELPNGPLVAGPLVPIEGNVVLAQVRVGPPPSMGSRGAGGHGFGGYVGPPPSRSWGSPGYGSGGFGGGYGGRYRGGYGYGALGPRWGPGFYVSGGLRGWYGPSVSYWGGPWGYPVGYGTWVTGWYSSGVRDMPSRDVVELAVPEGVLAPGAHVNGFLYFQRATSAESRVLTLTWQPHDARAGTPVGEARVTLEVVRR